MKEGKRICLISGSICCLIVFGIVSKPIAHVLLEHWRIYQVASGDVEQKRSAAEWLGREGSVGAVPVLLKESEASAEMALVEIGRSSERGRRAIEIGVKDESVEVRRMAVEVLGYMDGEEGETVRVLIGALDDVDTMVKMNALHGFRRMGVAAGRAITRVIELLKSQEAEEMRIVMVESLGSIGKKSIEARNVLLTILREKKESYAVRSAAGFGLAESRINVEETVSVLVDCLEDENMDVRLDAADALGHMGERAASARKALGELMLDDRRFVREVAERALRKIGPSLEGENASKGSMGVKIQE